MKESSFEDMVGIGGSDSGGVPPMQQDTSFEEMVGLVKPKEQMSIDMSSVPNVSSMERTLAPSDEFEDDLYGPLKPIVKDKMLGRETPTFDDEVTTGNTLFDKYAKGFTSASDGSISAPWNKAWKELGGLVTKDGKPDLTEFNSGVMQFGSEVAKFAMGVPAGFTYAAKEMVNQMSKGGLPTLVPDIDIEKGTFKGPLHNVNLKKVAKAFGEGVSTSHKFFDQDFGGGKLNDIIGEPNEISSKVGEIAMVPFTVVSAPFFHVANDKALDNYPNIQGASEIIGHVLGLASMKVVHFPKKGPLVQKFSTLEDANNPIAKIVKEAEPLIKEVTEVLKNPVSPTDLATQKINQIKLKQIDVQLAKIAKGIAGEELIYEEIGRQAETIAKRRVYPISNSGLGLKKPKPKDIKKVLKDEMPEGVEEVSIESMAGIEEPVGLKDAPLKITPDDKPGPFVGGGENFKLGDDKTFAGFEVDGNKVIVHDVLVDKVDRRHGKATEMLNTIEQSHPDKEVWIGSTNKQMDRVAEKNGYKLVSPRKEYIEGKVPDQVNDKNMAAYVKNVKEVISETPPPIEPIIKVDEKVGVEPDIYGKDSPFITDALHTETMREMYKELIENGKLRGPELGFSKLINDVNRWLHGDENISIEYTRTSLSRYAKDAASGHEKWKSVSEVDKQLAIDAAAWARRVDRSKIEPSAEMVTLYRAESPTVKYEDVFKSGGLTDYKPPKGIKGKFYTDSENVAGYYKDTYGKDATITKIEIPKSELEKYSTGHSGEYFVPDKVNKSVGSKIKRTKKSSVNQQKEKIDPKVSHTLYSDPFFLQAMADTARKFFKGDGKKLDLGKVPEGNIKESLKSGVAYSEAFNKDAAASKRNAKTSFKDAYDMTAEALWDTRTRMRRMFRATQRNKGLESASKAAEQKFINEAGGHAYGQIMFSQFDKEVYGGLSKHQASVLNKLIRGKRIQDIASYKPDAKFPKDQSFENTIFYEHGFEAIEGINSKVGADLLRRRDAYFEWMKDLVDELEKNGIVSKEVADGLKSHDYSKFKGIGQRLARDGKVDIETLYDSKTVSRVGGKAKSVNSSGIDSLAHGKKTDILEADQKITALEMFNRVYGRTFKNRAYQDLAALARTDANNGFVWLGKKEAKKAKETREASGVAESKALPMVDERGRVKYHFWEEGKKKAIYLDSHFAEGLEVAGRDLSPRVVAAAKLLSLSTPLKLMATGISPLWSTFVNFPIDQLTVFLTNGIYEGGKRKRIYSSNPAFSALQMGADLKATFYDTFFRAHDTLNRDIYMRSAERGMQMPFMTTQGRLSRKGYKLPGMWSKVEDVLGYHSTSMELWTRHAIANRMVKRRAGEQKITMKEAWADNKIVDEAVAMARDYLDFSQGGWLAKSLDQAGAVYLNAGIQANRALGRSLKENPKGTIAAITQSIGMATVGITAAAILQGSKTHREIPDYQEETNMNIPLPDSWRFKDSEGQERGMYISIPIGSAAGALKNVFKAGTMKALQEGGLTDEEANYGNVLRSFKQIAPDVYTLPPSLKGLIQYGMNVDFRTGRRITGEVFDYPNSKEEYTPGKTPQMAIDVGAVTGLSPDRLESMRSSILANNEWSALTGYGYDKMFGDVDKQMHEELLAVSMAKVPGFKRVFKLTKAGGELRDKQEEFKQQENLVRHVDDRNVDFYAKAAYWHGQEGARESLREYRRSEDMRKDVGRTERLMKQEQFIKDIRSLKNRDSWLTMYHEPAIVKAKDYLMKKQFAKTPEEQDSFNRQFRVVRSSGGYAGDNFWEEVGKLKRQGWTADSP